MQEIKKDLIERLQKFNEADESAGPFEVAEPPLNLKDVTETLIELAGACERFEKKLGLE